jgi:hypothetical protein
MKVCRNCGAELADWTAFCEVCGASQAIIGSSGTPKMNQQAVSPKTLLYVLVVALAIMGMLTVGLAVRGLGTVTQTTYVTQMQATTVTFTSSVTQSSTLTVASFSTLLAQPPQNWFNQQYCGYPFNPYVCNEGPPVTITGYLTNDTTCVTLYVGSGQNYIVWNLPKTYSTGAYQVYGFIYPNWPQTQPFPPYPFQKTICVGIPMWAVPPYIQPA